MDSGFLGPRFAMAVVLGLLVGALAIALVGGALLRLAVRWVGGYVPGYPRSCLAVLLACVMGVGVQVALALLLRRAMGFEGLMPGPLVSLGLALAGIAVTVAVTAAAVHLVLRRPDGTPLGMARASGAAALFVAVALVLYAVGLLLLFLLAGGVPGASR